MYHSISGLIHWYTSVTIVFPVGSTGTVVSLQYLLLATLVSSVITVSSDGTTGTLVQLQYLLLTPLQPYCHLRIFWWLFWYHSVTTVSPGSPGAISVTVVPRGGPNRTLASLQYLLVAPLAPQCHKSISC